MAADHLLSVRDDREVAQTEKVHLEQTELLDRDHGELRYHLVAVARKRDIGIDRVFGDDDAGGVGRAFRGMPSSLRAVSISSRTCGVPSPHLFQLRVDRSAFSMVICSSFGTCLATASTSLYGMLSARPTSRIAPRAGHRAGT